VQNLSAFFNFAPHLGQKLSVNLPNLTLY